MRFTIFGHKNPHSISVDRIILRVENFGTNRQNSDGIVRDISLLFQLSSSRSRPIVAEVKLPLILAFQLFRSNFFNLHQIREISRFQCPNNNLQLYYILDFSNSSRRRRSTKSRKRKDKKEVATRSNCVIVVTVIV